MAKWKFVSNHDYEFNAALPRYLRALGTFGAGLAVAIGGSAVIGFGGGRSHLPYVIGGILLLFGFVFITFGLVLWPWARVEWVKVYEEGLKWKDRRGEHKKKWEEVVSVSRNEMQYINPDGSGTDFGRIADFGLRFDDASFINFTTTLTDYNKLARYAQEQSAFRQQKGAEIDFAGDGRTFGAVHVARDGVTAFGRYFSWDDVGRLEVYNGDLIAGPSCKKWTPVPLAGISNYQVMLSLVRKIGRLRE